MTRLVIFFHVMVYSHSDGQQLYSTVYLFLRSHATNRVIITIWLMHSNDEMLSSGVFYLVDSLLLFGISLSLFWSPMGFSLLTLR